MIRQLLALIVSFHVLAAAQFFIRSPLHTPLFQRNGHFALTHNPYQSKILKSLWKIKQKIMRADKQLCNNLNRLRPFGTALKSRFGLLAQKSSSGLFFILQVLKRVFLVYSWYKLVSLCLEVYSSGHVKLQQLTEISSSISFVTKIIVDNGRWAVDNAQDFLTLMWLGMLLSSIVSGSYIFALALVVAKFHEFSRNAKLDACMGKHSE